MRRSGASGIAAAQVFEDRPQVVHRQRHGRDQVHVPEREPQVAGLAGVLMDQIEQGESPKQDDSVNRSCRAEPDTLERQTNTLFDLPARALKSIVSTPLTSSVTLM